MTEEMKPEEVIALALGDPDNLPLLRVFCLFSGGHDSSVLAHYCRSQYEELVFMDTGTALPGVRDFVVEFAAFVEKPLRVLEAGGAFRRMVLGGDDWWASYRPWAAERGLPWRDASTRRAFNEAERKKPGKGLAPQMPIGLIGPAGHNWAYQRLKERSLERLVRETRAERGAGRLRERVAVLSGVRVAESERRKMTTAAEGYYKREGNRLWVNPLYHWTNEQMRTYRREHALPESDVAALIHRSGECNCGAFASKGEREMLQQMYPDWWADLIAPLEAECERRGLPARWGERPKGMRRTRGGKLCEACPSQMAMDIGDGA